jgi:hypothetical protein
MDGELTPKQAKNQVRRSGNGGGNPDLVRTKGEGSSKMVYECQIDHCNGELAEE